MAHDQTQQALPGAEPERRVQEAFFGQGGNAVANALPLETLRGLVDIGAVRRTRTPMTPVTAPQQSAPELRDFSRYRFLAKAGTGLLVGGAVAYLMWSAAKPKH